MDAKCTIAASNGATGTLYAKVDAVTYNKFSFNVNTIRFRATDMAGNTGAQNSTVHVDTATAPLIIGAIIAAGTAAIAIVASVHVKRSRRFIPRKKTRIKTKKPPRDALGI